MAEAANKKDEHDTLMRAFLAAQREFEKVPKAESGHRNNKYASLDAVLDTILETLHNHGLVLYHVQGMEEGACYVEARLHHVATGEERTSRLYHPTSNDAQAVGSYTTYYRRYTTCSLLGLRAGEDDDGEGAKKPGAFKKQQPAKPAKATAAQVKRLRTLCARKGSNEGKIAEWAQVEKLEDMDGKVIESAIELLNKKPDAQPAQAEPGEDRGEGEG